MAPLTPKQMAYVLSVLGFSAAKYGRHQHKSYNKQILSKGRRQKGLVRDRRRSIMQSNILGKTQKDINSNIKKKVSELSKMQQASMGELIYRINDASFLGVAENLCTYSFQHLGYASEIETVLAQLRYYDPTAPTTLVTADFTTGSYSKDIRVVGMYLDYEVRANYKVPAAVRIYSCKVKSDTNYSPLNFIQDQDSDVSNVTYTSIGLYPNDFDLVTKNWDVKMIKNVVLEPGKKCKVRLSMPNHYNFDPSNFDYHNLNYQKQWGGSGLLTRLHGVLAHDTSLDEQGLGETKVDILARRVYKVMYNAGANIKFIYVDDTGLTAMTNTKGLTCIADDPTINAISFT